LKTCQLTAETLARYLSPNREEGRTKSRPYYYRAAQLADIIASEEPHLALYTTLTR
jgi:hypothetical protein